VIPSRLRVNKILLSRDPKYVNRLQLVGTKELVRAWLEGDWSAIEGAFFDEWSEGRHVIRPFAVPLDWKRFRSMDWGSARPFSVGWWALCPDDHEAFNLLGQALVIPRGALVRYREWYGAKAPNEGLKMTAEDVARASWSGRRCLGGMVSTSERPSRTGSWTPVPSSRTVARRSLR